MMATEDTPNGFERCNAAQFTNPPGTLDLLTMHFITGTNHVRLNPYTPDFMAAAAYAVPFAVGPELDHMQAQIDAVPGYKGTAHSAVTEWLFNSKGDGERNFTNESPSSRNEGRAVMIASTFDTYLLHNSEVKLVDILGLMEFAGIWKRREQVFALPAYYVFQMYSSSKGDTVLPVTTDSGTCSVKNGTQGYPDVSDVQYIDVVATQSKAKHTLTLFCVNRSLTDDTPSADRPGIVCSRRDRQGGAGYCGVSLCD
jgi:alpha-N-arabinofuranosidase